MKYISKGAKLRIVIVPARHIYDNLGQRQYQAGKEAQFENHMFETEDKEIIKFLSTSKSLGNEFWLADGQKTEMTEEGKQVALQDKATVEGTMRTCPECGKECINESGLRLHMRVHAK